MGRYLPDFANAEVRDKVTGPAAALAHLGPGRFFGPKLDEKKLHMREVRDDLPLIAEEKLQFEPGTSYSNSGFVHLNAIVEKHVYAPAGMKNSDCHDVDRDVPPRALARKRRARADQQKSPEGRNLPGFPLLRGGRDSNPRPPA